MLESYFNKVAGLQAYNFIKKRLQHRCFPVNITKLLRTSILKNIGKVASVSCAKYCANKTVPQNSAILYRINQRKLYSNDQTKLHGGRFC